MAEGSGGGVGGIFGLVGKLFTGLFSSRKMLFITSTTVFFFILTILALQESVKAQSFEPFYKRVGGVIFGADKELSENIAKYRASEGGVFHNKLLVMAIIANLYFLIVFVTLVFQLLRWMFSGSIPASNLVLLALIMTATFQIIYSLVAYQQFYIPFRGFFMFFWDFLFKIDWGAIYRVLLKIKKIDVPLTPG